MAVPSSAAARHRSRPAPARLLLHGLYCAAAVTALALGAWPQWLIVAALFTAAACRAAVSRPRAGALRRPHGADRAPGEPVGDRSRA
ncbi:hypothetical protein ACH4L5_36095 [Streptomyces sp. NPDC017405]|uniref:hypothetical protein n=1 Tax=unclassified Streptomyces TaxID=2593676 RepID=UPI003444ADF1